MKNSARGVGLYSKHIFRPARGSEISLDQRGGQRHLWTREGFRDIFGRERGLETSLDGRGV